MRSPRRGPLPLPVPIADQLRSRKQCCTVQVLRSVGQWSSGTRLESSVHGAYLSAIHNAKSHIMILNQFFISGQVCEWLCVLGRSWCQGQAHTAQLSLSHCLLPLSSLYPTSLSSLAPRSSSQEGDGVVGNRIAAALVDRILRAALARKPFKVSCRAVFVVCTGCCALCLMPAVKSAECVCVCVF